MLFSAFIFGFLSAILALVLEIILIPSESFPQVTALSWSVRSMLLLIGVAFIEESSKYLFLSRYLLQFSENAVTVSQKIFLGALFGLGFGSLELTLAYYGTRFSQIDTWFFGIVFLHIATSLILVAFLHRFQNVRNKFLLPILVATLTHLLYNVLLSFILS